MGIDNNEFINSIANLTSILASAGIDAHYGAVQLDRFANGGNPVLLTDEDNDSGSSGFAVADQP